MTLNITDAELHEWARMRADDAGRLARELVACRLQSQADVAAAYEAAAKKLHWLWNADGTVTERRVSETSQAAIRALATPDQIAALAAKVDREKNRISLSEAQIIALLNCNTVGLPKNEAKVIKDLFEKLGTAYILTEG